MAVDFDLILPDVGEYGTYQKLMVWLVFLPGMIPCGFHAYNQLFMATQPKFRCLVPDLDTSIRNLTDDFIRNIRFVSLKLFCRTICWHETKHSTKLLNKQSCFKHRSLFFIL